MAYKETGLISPLVVATVVLSVLVVGLGVFGFWSFSQYRSYKDDVDPKIEAAVTAAKAEQRSKDQKDFDEQEKLPTRQLVGPEDLGKVTVDYPKTWSVYIDKFGEGGQYDAYLYPGAVPSLNSRTPFALRVSVQSTAYESAVRDFESLVKSGKLRASPVKVGDADGLRLDGTFPNDIEGSMVLFKVRDKTLKIYTQAANFVPDFNNTVLPSLKFNK